MGSTNRRKLKFTRRRSRADVDRIGSTAPGEKAGPIFDVPRAVSDAIEEQRGSITSSMALLYCLHSALRRGLEDAGPLESEAVQAAVSWVDLTQISATLLVQLHAIHLALDSASLNNAGACFAERASP